MTFREQPQINGTRGGRGGPQANGFRGGRGGAPAGFNAVPPPSTLENRGRGGRGRGAPRGRGVPRGRGGAVQVPQT